MKEEHFTKFQRIIEVPENYRMQLTLTEWEVTVFCKRDVICKAISAHFTARLAEPCHASAVIL